MLWLLTAQFAPGVIPLIIIGGLGMLFAILRLLSIFIQTEGLSSAPTPQKEPANLTVPIILVLILMLTMALAPQIILPRMLEILAPFTNLTH